MSTVFNKLLIFLCLADLLFLLCSFVLSVQSTLEVSVSRANNPSCVREKFAQIVQLLSSQLALPESLNLVLECLCHLALSTSVFLTASCTIERHQAGKQSSENNCLYDFTAFSLKRRSVVSQYDHLTGL